MGGAGISAPWRRMILIPCPAWARCSARTATRSIRAAKSASPISVRRAEKVTVEALDREGKPFTLEADGLLAVCIQHEMDHLKGKVFVEYLSQLKQGRIKNKLKKRLRETM